MGLMLEFSQRLNRVLSETFTDEQSEEDKRLAKKQKRDDEDKEEPKKSKTPSLRAAVGIVQCGDRWLLGLATKTMDDRTGTWVCPGGGVKSGETAERAAVREVWEETGIRCRAVGKPFRLPNRPDVAFVHCKAAKGQKFNNNHEFSALGWFKKRELRSLKLYHNVKKLLDRV